MGVRPLAVVAARGYLLTTDLYNKGAYIMSYFELEPFGRAPDGHDGFPNSYRVYDTFRGRVFIGTIIFMTNLKMFRTTSVYASEEELKNFSIESLGRWEGDVSYEDTDPVVEAKKLYKLYLSKLGWRERKSRAMGTWADMWWPMFIAISSITIAIATIPIGVLAIIQIMSKFN